MPDPSRPKIEGHVIVVTYGRSGSTLVQSILNTLPGYCIRGENADVLGPFARAWANVKDNPVLQNLARHQTATEPDHPWFGGQSIAPRALGRALARLFVKEVLRPPPGTRVAGFKEIRWGRAPAALPTTLRFARTFLPNAKFVFNTRDHDQVVRSSWWASEPEAEVRALLAQWEATYDAFLASHPALGVKVHYNDYIRDPEALRPMLDFLGEEFDAATVARVLAKPLTHAKEDWIRIEQD